MNIQSVCVRGLVLTGLWIGLTAAVHPARTFYDPKTKLPPNSPWLSKPDGLALSRVYPARAAHDYMSGAVLLKCRVEPTGYVSGCIAAGEDPPGYGFGEAALKLTPNFRFKPSASGGPPVGDTVSIPVRFNASELRRPMNLHPGDAAILMTELKGARPPGRAIFHCPDPDAKARYCLWSLITWAELPDPQATAAAIEASDLSTGKSLLECAAAPDGALIGCRVSGEKTPKAEAALLALAKGFRVDPKARDGTPVTTGRILVEFNWALLKATIAKID